MAEVNRDDHEDCAACLEAGEEPGNDVGACLYHEGYGDGWTGAAEAVAKVLEGES